jgi:FkbM family methyltransferase
VGQSHSLDLVIEAVRAAELSCWGKRPALLECPASTPVDPGIGEPTEPVSDVPAESRFNRLTYALNHLAHAVGLHVSRVSAMQRAARATAESLKSAAEALEAATKVGESAAKSLREAVSAYSSLWYDGIGKAIGMGTLLRVLDDTQGFDEVYSKLADDSSRHVFDWFIKFRVAYALVGEEARTLFPAAESSASYAVRCWTLAKAPGGGFAVGDWTIDSEAGAVVDSMILEQYFLPGIAEPGVGSVILDVGAYKGETAVWLAGKAGPTGVVYAFEPDPATIDTLRANIERNKGVGQAPIRPLAFGIGGMPGKMHFASTHSGGSHMDPAGETTVDVTTIDLAVEDLHLDRVDFIKMDIEGGEVDALRGAQSTLRRLGPRLAICVYHNSHDLPDIATLVRQARPDYSLYLSHRSPNWNETVLFACIPMPNGAEST